MRFCDSAVTLLCKQWAAACLVGSLRVVGRPVARCGGRTLLAHSEAGGFEDWLRRNNARNPTDLARKIDSADSADWIPAYLGGIAAPGDPAVPRQRAE